MLIIGLYVGAIVAANVAVDAFGPGFSIVNAFLFIGLNLTARDRLHDQWEGEKLASRMFVLILAGALISGLLGTGRIAIASFVAFMVSESADAVTYHLLGDRRRLVRINGSNVIGAIVDSTLFATIAFGFPILLWVILGQIAAKIGGGFLWSLVLTYKQEPEPDDNWATRAKTIGAPIKSEHLEEVIDSLELTIDDMQQTIDTLEAELKGERDRREEDRRRAVLFIEEGANHLAEVIHEIYDGVE